MEAGKENFSDEIIDKNLLMGVKEWLDMALSHCLFETDFGWMILQKDETGLIKSTIPVESRDICIKKISGE